MSEVDLIRLNGQCSINSVNYEGLRKWADAHGIFVGHSEIDVPHDGGGPYYEFYLERNDYVRHSREINAILNPLDNPPIDWWIPAGLMKERYISARWKLDQLGIDMETVQL